MGEPPIGKENAKSNDTKLWVSIPVRYLNYFYFTLQSYKQNKTINSTSGNHPIYTSLNIEK